jgi:hypothetical protein
VTGDASRISFLGRQLPDAFTLRVVTVPPGRPYAYQAAEWRDCLVVVESGELALEHADGCRHRFGPGCLLALDNMSLRWLHAAGPGPVVLSAVSRRSRSV